MMSTSILSLKAQGTPWKGREGRKRVRVRRDEGPRNQVLSHHTQSSYELTEIEEAVYISPTVVCTRVFVYYVFMPSNLVFL